MDTTTRIFDFSNIETKARMTREAIRNHCGVSHSKLIYWDRSGMTLDEALYVCDALDLHPANVWPDWVSLVFESRQGVAEQRVLFFEEAA